MSVRHCIFALLPCVMCACRATDRPADAGPPFDAELEIADWLEAWNTRDLSRVDELFLNDSGVTYFSSEREGLIRGFAAIRDHHASFGFVPAGDTPADELWVEDIHVSVYPMSAVVAGIWYFGDRAAGPHGVQSGPMTVVYVLDGSVYRIVHMHFSEYPAAEFSGGDGGGGTG